MAVFRAPRGDLAGAVTSYRKALAIDPQYAEVHCNLAGVFKQQGKFVEALESMRRGHELGSKRNNWKYPTARWVASAERRVELDRKASAIIRGEEESATPRERLEMGTLLYYKQDYPNVARFYDDAFKADPKLADDLGAGFRHQAARAAALARSPTAMKRKSPPSSSRLCTSRLARGCKQTCCC